MKDTYKINNNGKNIGKINLNNELVRNLVIGASIGLVLEVTALTAAHAVWNNNKKEETKTVYEEINENQNKYDIDYTVKDGETLLSILYTYENDPEVIDNLRKKTISSNELTENGYVYAGERIKLFDVPQDKLNYFGYTTDYDNAVISQDEKLEDYIRYANDAYESPKPGVENSVNYEIFGGDVEKLNSEYQNYLGATDSEKEELFNELYSDALEVDKEGYKLSDLSFEDIEKAYKSK